MSRVQNAIGRADMDAYARSIGLRDAAEYHAHLKLHRRLDTGGRLTPADLEAAHRRGGYTVEGLNAVSDYVMAGATARDRADRYAACISHAIERVTGHPVKHDFVRDLARQQGEQLEVQDFVAPITGRLNERDAHRDRQNGIDQRARVEAARRAALTPENQRRADIEREWSRHAGPTPRFAAHERREILAQASDRLAERIVKQQMRDADTSRLPDRGDDRREDIALEIDNHMVQSGADDEIALASNPLLESIDNAATASRAGEET